MKLQFVIQNKKQRVRITSPHTITCCLRKNLMLLKGTNNPRTYDFLFFRNPEVLKITHSIILWKGMIYVEHGYVCKKIKVTTTGHREDNLPCPVKTYSMVRFYDIWSWFHILWLCMTLQWFRYAILSYLVSWHHFNITSYQNMLCYYNLHLATISTFHHFRICNFKIVLNTSPLHYLHIYAL